MISEENRRLALRRGCMAGTAIGLLFALGLVPVPAIAQELPTGGSVTVGAATITNSGPNLLVTQTTRNAILSWESFSIGGGASAHFENGSGATLNRVTGNLPSAIDGSLTATGSLYLINPAGVAVGTGGMVKTAGSFVASTQDASDADFLDSGDLTLKGLSKAEIVNGGFIASLEGDVVLTARRVENSGTIDAPNGSIGLLGGYEVLLRDTSLADGKFAVKVGGDDTQVVNSGTVRAAEIEMRANGGRVEALAGNTKAIVKATGVKKVGGRIFLTAGEGGSVKATQRIVARRAANPAQRRQVAALPAIGPIPAARPDFFGGEVHVAGGSISLGGAVDATGNNGKGGTVVAVADHALTLSADAALDVSGSDGGLVLLGGDYQGGGRYWGAPLATTARTTVMEGATIRADGVTGAGGDIVVWADERTSFAGAISAKGVTVGGDAEVSGKAVLDFTGSADLTATSGAFGTLLLDPYDVTISAGADTSGFTAAANDSVINATTLLTALNTANVTVWTGADGSQAGDIKVAADLAWASDATLTLDAAKDIALDAAITARAGGLTLNAGGAITASGAVDIARFTLQNGNWVQNIAILPAFAAGDFRITGGSFLRAAGGDGTAGNPWMLTDIYGVQGMGTHLAGNFALSGDIDASSTQYWWDSAGFAPVGGSAVGGQFTGTFNGAGHVISGLTIDRPEQNDVGLFGEARPAASGVATISNIGLDGVSVTGANSVGGLVGRLDDGTISQAWVSGTVKGNKGVGGLVGRKHGDISQVWTDTAVKGTADYIGGLVGYDEAGTISQAWARNNVAGVRFVGGLVGRMANGTISQAWAGGAVTGDSNVGGLVGYQGGGSKISQAWVTGAVIGDSNVGGLLGVQNGRIEQVWASGLVTGTDTDTVGGLVGYQLMNDFGWVFWDKETTSQDYGVGMASPRFGEFPNSWGRTTAQARSAVSYTEWDFTSDWYQAGDMRPVGRWMAALPDANGDIAVSNLIQLQLMDADLDASYVLTRDIDASATASTADSPGIWGAGGFVPVGRGFGSSSFTGSFDGGGHVISGLTIARPAQGNVGLFGYILDATIADVGLDGGSVAGDWYVGGLVGFQASGTISHAWSSVAASGNLAVGGLVGYQGRYATDSTISESWASGTVSGTQRIGGLVGMQSGIVGISRSWASGEVSGDNYIGGLVGYQTSDASISRSWASSTVSGGETVGGLVGQQGELGGGLTSIDHSWASGAVSGTGFLGGFVGNQVNGSITASYWDISTTGMGTQGRGGGSGTFEVTGLSTALARDKANYTGWDFTTDWYQAGDMRPVGRWMAPPDTDGDGVREISTTMQLQLVDADRSGSYVLTRDLDASAADGSDTSGIWGPGGFVPISSFSGRFDGKGHVISGLTIQRPLQDQVGLFGGVNSATISHVGLHGVSISGQNSVGGLVGRQTGGTIGQAWASGTVNGGNYVGGLVGRQIVSAIGQAWASGTVNGGNYVGGLVGLSDANGTISQSRADVNVSGDTYIGGLAGAYDNGTIMQASASGAVSGKDNVGGLAGSAYMSSITQAWASGAVTSSGGFVGGLVGYSIVTPIRASFWDASTAGQVSSPGGMGLTTAQFQDTAGFMALAAANDWDFSTVWAPPSAGYYPQLYALSHVVAVDVSTSRLYGEANDSAALNYYGLQPGDFLTGRATLAGIDATTGVGTYAVTAAGGTTTTNPEAYRFVTIPGTLKIAPRPLTVTGTSIERTYGDANPATTTAFNAPTGSAGSGSGLVNGDTIGLVTVDSTAGATSAAGSYVFTPGGANFIAGSAGNYVITYADGTLKVTPREITVTALGGTSVYGDGAVNPGLSATNLANDEDVTVLGGLYNSFGILPTTTAGAHTLSVAGRLNNGNYVVMGTIDGTWTVNPATLMVTANDAAKTYDGLAWSGGNGVSYSGFVNGEDASTLGGTLVWSGTSQGAKNAATYTIAASGLSSGNYSIGYTPGTLTIDPRPITVTALGGTSIYSDSPADPGLSASNLANGEDVTVLTGLSNSFGIQPTTGAGSYALGVSGTLTNDNYKVSGTTGGTWTVKPATLTVIASNGSMIYGGALPTLGYSVGGWKNSQGGSLLGGVTVATDATSASNVGAGYVTSASGGTLSGVAAGNYTIDYVDGVFSVTPRAITVSADDQSRLLGQPDPELTWALTGGSFASFDTDGTVFSGRLTRDPGETVGNYAIGQGTLAANANYTLGFIGGVLTIGPVAMTQDQMLERSPADEMFFMASSGGDGPTECAEGVLGPVCAAFVNPANRHLGPHIFWQAP